MIGNPSDVKTILADEYFKVDLEKNQSAQVGDVAIFSDDKGNIIHSMTVSGVGENGIPTAVTGLGGTNAASRNVSPEEELKRYAELGATTINYFHKTNSDPHAMSVQDKQNYKKPTENQKQGE